LNEKKMIGFYAGEHNYKESLKQKNTKRGGFAWNWCTNRCILKHK
jgi:hypothetical protein